MNVFKINSFYRYSLALLSILALVFTIISIFFSESRAQIFIAASVFVLLAVFTLYNRSISVEIGDGKIVKKRIFLNKSFFFSDIEEVTSIELTTLSFRASFVFLLITKDSFFSISTHFERFVELRKLITDNLKDNVSNALTTVSDAQIAKKNRGTKIAVLILFTFFIACFVKEFMRIYHIRG